MPTMSERIFQAAKIAADTGLTLEIQTLTLQDGGDDPTSGTFLLDNATSTATLDFDSSAATVEAALVALDEYEEDDIICGGGPLPGTDVTITFTGRQEGARATLTATNGNLDDGTPSVTETQAGQDGVRKDLRDAATAFDAAIKQIWSDAGLDSGAAPWIGAVEDDIVKIVSRVAANLRV